VKKEAEKKWVKKEKKRKIALLQPFLRVFCGESDGDEQDGDWRRRSTGGLPLRTAPRDASGRA
jgi:hypothetical protein